MRFSRLSLAGFPALAASVLVWGCASSPSALPRSEADRLDDLSGHQIHVMYVLPSDGADQFLDTNGTIVKSVAAARKWLQRQTGGRSLRFDEYRGSLDITFHRLALSDRELRSAGKRVRDRMEKVLRARFDSPDKIYAVYYGGTHDFNCADGFHPPDLDGKVVALYLLGLPGASDACANNPFAGSVDQPGYWEFSLLHEIFHGLGAVDSCAPHYACHTSTDPACENHVGDDRHDLMYQGKEVWDPSILDKDRDDYFGNGRSGCFDVSGSPFLTR